MFIKVTRSAAVSALAAGYEVRLNATGEIFQLGAGRSKRACRRMMTRWNTFGYWYQMNDGQVPDISYSIRV